MIEFMEKIQEVLPYDREKYIDFLDDEFEGPTEWCGVSFQLHKHEKEITLTEFIEVYESLFKKIILKVDNGSVWIVNHDIYNTEWFPNDEDNLTDLRNVFKKNNVSNLFEGALVLEKDDLLKLSKDLISYPIAVFNENGLLYDDLDISHSELQFIVKVSHHTNIDFLSTDEEILRQIVKENSSSIFNVKQYNGTSLW